MSHPSQLVSVSTPEHGLAPAWLTRTHSRLRQTTDTVRLFANFPSVFANRLGIAKRSAPWVIRVRSGARYKVRPGKSGCADVYVVREAWLQGLHDRLLNAFVGPGATVIDVGAHIGAFAIKAATRALSVRVLCFEPDFENHLLLKDNIHLNGLQDRVEAHPVALWSAAGAHTLFMTDHGATQSFFREHFEQYHLPCAGQCSVPCTTLQAIFDSVPLQRCDLLKLDCEGAEYQILYQTPPEVLSRVRSVALECHRIPDESVEQLREFLLRAGFEVSHPIPDRPDVLHAARKTGAATSVPGARGKQVSLSENSGITGISRNGEPPSVLPGFRGHWRRRLADEGSGESSALAEAGQLPFVAMLERLLREPNAPGARRVLEVGAGAATVSHMLARKYSGGFYALDILPEAVAVAHRAMNNGPAAAVQLLVADVCHAPLPDASFDIVFSQGLLEHFRDPSEILAAQVRLLRPGGTLVVNVPQKFNLFTLFKRHRMRRGAWPPGWETEFSPRELIRLGKRFGLAASRVDGHGSVLSQVAVRLLRRVLSPAAQARIVRLADGADRALGRTLRAWLCTQLIVGFRKPALPPATRSGA